MTATTTNLVFDYRVTNISEAPEDRVSINLLQVMPGQENVSPGMMVSPGGMVTTLLMDRDSAREIFPGDFYTVTFARKTS